MQFSMYASCLIINVKFICCVWICKNFIIFYSKFIYEIRKKSFRIFFSFPIYKNIEYVWPVLCFQDEADNVKKITTDVANVHLCFYNMENSKDDIKRLPVIFTVIHLVGEEFLNKLKTLNLNQTLNFHIQ